MTETLPLFPLNLVLFPGARLPLRIFESRYIDMVRECMRKQTGFGVVWRMDTTSESGHGHALVGTEATIEDFSMLEDGLLGIECRGQRRFRIQATRARDNGLLIGDVEWLKDQPAAAISAHHAALQSLLREIQQHRELAGQIDADADDAVSLGLGLASVLPIDRPRAQNLLEMTHPEQRLDAIMAIVEHSLQNESGDDGRSEGSA
ncbi:MAG: LON peptidase substrate-binding domain-containing protein [Wenzhouxiangella sp.]